MPKQKDLVTLLKETIEKQKQDIAKSKVMQYPEPR